MDRKAYIIIILLLGLTILISLVLGYDSRERPLAEENGDDVRVKLRELVPIERFRGGTVSEKPPVIIRDQELSEAARSARRALASRLGIDENTILITSVESRDWPNSCLGLEQPGEFCAQVITSGFQVTMEAQGRIYVYRTNMDGSGVRAAN